MMNDLESILNCLGSGKPFRKAPVVVGTEDGENVMSDVTKSGWKAYGKLTDIIYALEAMDVIDNANDIVEQLDDIIGSNDGAYKG